jgi:hypothetical protein
MKIESLKPRNYVAKDLFTPKYKIRTVSSKKNYNRNLEKQKLRKEVLNEY